MSQIIQLDEDEVQVVSPQRGMGHERGVNSNPLLPKNKRIRRKPKWVNGLQSQSYLGLRSVIFSPSSNLSATVSPLFNFLQITQPSDAPRQNYNPAESPSNDSSALRSDNFSSKRHRSVSPSNAFDAGRRRISVSPGRLDRERDHAMDLDRGYVRDEYRNAERRSVSRDERSGHFHHSNDLPQRSPSRSPPRRTSSRDRGRRSPLNRGQSRERSLSPERQRGRDEYRPNHGDGSSRSLEHKRRISPSERPKPAPSKTLGVFGLSILTQEHDIDRLFRVYGRIEKISVLKDKITGKSRGYGFITYTDVESATKAIEGLNGFVFNDRQMRVDYTLSTKRVQSPSSSSRNRQASPPVPLTHGLPPVPIPGGDPRAAAAYPGYPMPYGYFPFPYGYPYPPIDGDGKGRDGKSGRKDGDPHVHVPPPIMYYDPRNPAPAGGVPPPFPFALPPGYPAPPFHYDPRAIGDLRRRDDRDDRRDRDRRSGGDDRRGRGGDDRGGDDRRSSRRDDDRRSDRVDDRGRRRDNSQDVGSGGYAVSREDTRRSKTGGGYDGDNYRRREYESEPRSRRGD
ncbi:hypothetical protein CcCBS67573_g02264 [Chytriomyces confervae]|uniref:RRM domain-containing protein n=1 Tax=Chytriomyces confervae TaxID=246404 RepID=A0A507FJR8_9FUNG|nr:hypothetical protein CcCBS67573_g02264 [Chytriomyces confervae]